MKFLYIGGGICVVAVALLSLALTWIVGKARGRTGAASLKTWRRMQWFLLPLALFIIFPVLLGYLGSTRVGTRPDERSYAGPRLSREGTWLPQFRTRSQAEAADADRAPSAEILNAAKERAVSFQSQDGVNLRGWLVRNPKRAAPPTIAIIVHGLFRGGMEIDPVGQMFYSLGQDVLLLEMRNHGGSGKAAFGGGANEALDVRSAADWVKSQPEFEQHQIVLFGVSLGTAAVALAAPHVEGLSAVVLEAPVSSLRASAERQLGPGGAGLPNPWRALSLYAFQLFSGFRFDDVDPRAALSKLPTNLPLLIIGGGRDKRMPPHEVKEFFSALPTQAESKELWIHDPSDHGKVWLDAPAKYHKRLVRLMSRIPEK